VEVRINPRCEERVKELVARAMAGTMIEESEAREVSSCVSIEGAKIGLSHVDADHELAIVAFTRGIVPLEVVAAEVVSVARYVLGEHRMRLDTEDYAALDSFRGIDRVAVLIWSEYDGGKELVKVAEMVKSELGDRVSIAVELTSSRVNLSVVEHCASSSAIDEVVLPYRASIFILFRHSPKVVPIVSPDMLKMRFSDKVVIQLEDFSDLFKLVAYRDKLREADAVLTPFASLRKVFPCLRPSRRKVWVFVDGSGIFSSIEEGGS